MRVIFVAALLALAGCVQTTSSALDERTMSISARGGGGDSPAAVDKALLQEAAKQATSRGYRYFAVLSDRAGSVPGALILSGSSTTNGQIDRSGVFTATTTSSPSFVHGYVRPTGDIRVRFFAEGEIDPRTPGVWDARSVLAAGG